ncbi:hypothetical protein KC315_g8017 [Hortaea werneckii]|nr:hypothetical protein KC315_g8017 [Hortaea werneckii]KAI7365712.1 hypothetical protein KC354_g4695 [Hortaea werneckii]
MSDPSLYTFPSPLEGWRQGEPLPDQQHSEGPNAKSYVNPPPTNPSPAYKEFTNPITNSTRGGFDVHIYYLQTNTSESQFAQELWERIRREFPELRIYRVWDKPIGPHPVAMFEVNLFTPEQFGAFVPWLVIHRGPLSVLLHPNTGDDVRDHTQLATCTSKGATSSQHNDHFHSDDAMPWLMSDAAQKYCGLLALQRTASIADIKAAHRRVRRLLRERGLSARSQERVLAADLKTLLLGQCSPLEQDKYLEAIRAAGFATREGVLQAALTGQSTRVPEDEAPALQAAELAASILDFIDGQCDWPEVLGVAETACGKEIKRAFYNALCCLREDEYRESDVVMFGLRTMQDTIKSQRSDVFPKEKYVSSNPAERQYDKEFVKLNEDDDRSNDADEFRPGAMSASDEDDEEFADTGSMNTSDGDYEDLASTASMDASEDDEEDGVNDDGDFCGMDFMYHECSDCDDEEEMKAEKL